MLISGRNAGAQELDDLARRRARREDGGHAVRLQLLGVVGRDRPSEHDQHVLGALRSQAVEDLRHERHVGAGEDRDADRVRVLLDRRLDDLLRRLVETGVDDLHPGVPEGSGDDLGAAVVPVQAGLRDHHTDLAGHGCASIWRCS
jgi:hypothetical protein